VSRICVVIPMYGKEEYTKKCIDLTYQNAGTEIDVLVVDDGSPVEFEQPYDSTKPFVTLRLAQNSGFTNATNQGILWAQKRDYDYVHCLNNDTEPEADFIKNQLEVMESDPKIGICGSVRKYPDGRKELCGADLIRGHQYFSTPELPESPMDVNWLPICSSLIRMDMIREIGLLDKRFRTHCSDSDYCIHAKMRGWRVMLVPKSVVIHHLSVTTKSLGIEASDDQRLFIEKLAGLEYARLMNEMPLDCSTKQYGKLEFSVYTK